MTIALTAQRPHPARLAVPSIALISWEAWGLRNAVPQEKKLSCAILAGPSSRLLRLETWLHPGARMWRLASAGYWITALSVTEKIVVLQVCLPCFGYSIIQARGAWFWTFHPADFTTGIAAAHGNGDLLVKLSGAWLLVYLIYSPIRWRNIPFWLHKSKIALLSVVRRQSCGLIWKSLWILSMNSN